MRRETRRLLQKSGYKGQTYDEVINEIVASRQRLIDELEECKKKGSLVTISTPSQTYQQSTEERTK